MKAILCILLLLTSSLNVVAQLNIIPKDSGIKEGEFIRPQVCLFPCL